MHKLHATFSLELLALSAGAALLIWAMRNKGTGVLVGKTIGALVTVLSLLGLFCTGYSGVQFWSKGGHHRHGHMHHKMMKKMPHMMHEMMEKMEHMGKDGESESHEDEDHEAGHKH